MPARTTVAYAFRSTLGLGEIHAKLDALGPTPWQTGDSHWHGDYLGGRLSEVAVVRIYPQDDGYIANLRFYSAQGDAKAQLQAATHRLLDVVLPAIEATGVRAAEPLE